MKNLLFILLLLFLLGFSNVVKSQQSQIKFMAYSVLVYNKASVSYEYSINKKSSVGIQYYGYFALTPEPVVYYANGVRLAYRFYPGLTPPKKDGLFFLQGEGNFYFLYDDFWKRYTSLNSGIGLLIGIRDMFGNSDKWFIDFALGASADYRTYQNPIISYTDEGHIWIKPKPPNSFYFMPRITIEIGVKL